MYFGHKLCKRVNGPSQIKRLFLAGLVAAWVCSLGLTDVAEAAPSSSRTLEASFKNPPGLGAPEKIILDDLYAYYTRLDYQIPLSEIDVRVPYLNAEHIRAYWAYWKPRVAPAIASDAPRPENPILKIGAACPDFGGRFEGSIDQVGIYNRKLSREDLVRLAAGKAVDTALVANYRFNRSMADAVGGKSALAHGEATFSSDSREGSHSLQLDGRAMWMELPVECIEVMFPQMCSQPGSADSERTPCGPVHRRRDTPDIRILVEHPAIGSVMLTGYLTALIR